MLERRDLSDLLAAHEAPCVTILVPARRETGDARATATALKNLVRQAGRVLAKRAPRRVGKAVLERLEALAREVDTRSLEAGLALFASPDFARRLDLSFHVDEACVVDTTFATRALVRGLDESGRYRVLVLGDRPTRIFEGRKDVLSEVHDEDFPMVHEGVGGAAPMPGKRAPLARRRQWPRPGGSRKTPNFGSEPTKYDEAYHRQFYRSVDLALARLERSEPLPLVVVGSERRLGTFLAVTKRREAPLLAVRGAHENDPATVLARLVWSRVEGRLRVARVERARRELGAAAASGRLATGLEAAARAAGEGRGVTLVVEEGYRKPSRRGDAVEALVEAVLGAGGEALFVPDGLLAEHERVALTLRARRRRAA